MNLSKVLLLGDSIRLSYQPVVAKLLTGRGEVVGPEENGQFALYTLSALGRWLGQLGKPDLVHWNNGLHDVGHNPARCPVQFSLADYVGNLGHILRQLRPTGARIIWASTTPIQPGTPCHTDRWGWRNEEIADYNRAAAELMAREGVPVNDLHAVVIADPKRYIADDDLHLSPDGVRACAQAVAEAIERELNA